MQAIENVAGVNQVSEGQAAVPAIRGLARGRTLILIDGARVSSERRAGPSATFLDPTVVEGIDVARGPGSVAYGSDAFGGVISVRTRRVVPGSPLSAQFSGTIGAGIPEKRGAVEDLEGTDQAAECCSPRTRATSDDWDSPVGRSVQLGLSAITASSAASSTRPVPAPSRLSWQSDFGRDIERPRNNSRRCASYYPTENSHRFTTGYEAGNVAGFQRVGFTGFLGGRSISGPIRIGSRPRRPAAPSSAPTSRPTTFTCAASARACSARRGSRSASTSTAASI